MKGERLASGGTTMRFANRRQAGQLLAKRLDHYRSHPTAVVLGLPRGGVPVAYEVATRLHLPLDITCPHKIGAPGSPEYAIGAVTERGDALLNETVIDRWGIPKEYLRREIERWTSQARSRLKTYRHDPTPRDVKGKVVILVDDGLATGFTMKAAVKSMRTEQAATVVVAVPVSPPNTAEQFVSLVDEFVCLQTPDEFAAVGQFYVEFEATSDEEVIELLRQARSLV